jgi:ubiquinone/menaquinone biosynthesis C-methylase UbiE
MLLYSSFDVMSNFSDRSKSAYNIKANGYDNSREGQFTRNIHRILLTMVEWHENQRILDVACGTGSFLAAMNARKPIAGFGIDIAQHMIEKAAEKNPGMEFRVSGCESIPFPDGSMDLITVCAAYHHFSDVAAFAREARRVLKPGGMLYIADMFVPSLIRVTLNPFVPFLFKDGDVKFYSPKQIADNFKRYMFYEISAKTSGNVQVVSMRKSIAEKTD